MKNKEPTVHLIKISCCEALYQHRYGLGNYSIYVSQTVSVY